MTESFSVQSAKDKALAEIQKERIEKATKQIKSKLQELEAAKLVVKNIEREMEALEDELSHGL